jgi:NADH dehydrogenase
MPKKYAVTGASGYSGRYITRLLLDQGNSVLTLTGHPDRPHPFGDQISLAPFNFDNPDALARSLEGVNVLINTYWVRFSYGKTTHQQAVENTKILFNAAKQAGVKRIVHVSIANPAQGVGLPYYQGKLALEQALMATGVSYAILRPAVLFGGATPAEDVLINNIAWLLRRFPAFAIPGDGQYGIQPIHVEDMARLAVKASQSRDNQIIDAVGPEKYAFAELVWLVAQAVGSRAWIFNAPPALALAASQVISLFVGDVMLTQDEVAGLLADLLVSAHPPTGTTKLSAWLAENAHLMGARYASEVGRHFR